MYLRERHLLKSILLQIHCAGCKRSPSIMFSKGVFLSLDSSCFLLAVTKLVKHGVFKIFWSFKELYLPFFFSSFFFPNSISVGRILNRFSKDIGHLDDLLPLTFLDFVQVIQLLLHCMLNLDSCKLWWKSAICHRCSLV